MGEINRASTQTAASTHQTEASVNNIIEIAHHLEQATARYSLQD